MGLPGIKKFLPSSGELTSIRRSAELNQPSKNAKMLKTAFLTIQKGTVLYNDSSRLMVGRANVAKSYLSNRASALDLWRINGWRVESCKHGGLERAIRWRTRVTLACSSRPCGGSTVISGSSSTIEGDCLLFLHSCYCISRPSLDARSMRERFPGCNLLTCIRETLFGSYASPRGSANVSHPDSLMKRVPRRELNM